MTPETPHDPERFENTTKLSDALEIAVEDMSYLQKSENPPIHFDMAGWLHGHFTDDKNPGEPTACSVCMAGAVLIRRFNGLKTIRRLRELRRTTQIMVFDSDLVEDYKTDDRDAQHRVSQKLIALDSAREGGYRTAIRTGWPKLFQALSSSTLKKLDDIDASLFYDQCFSTFSRDMIQEGLVDLRDRIIPTLRQLGA